MNITEIKAHDLATYELAVALGKAEQNASYKLDRIHDEAGDRRVNMSKRYGYSDWQWPMSDEDAIAKVQGIVANPKSKYDREIEDRDDDYWSYIGREAQKKLDEYTEAVQEIHNLRVQLNTLEAVFAANRWSRFEAVPGGHIHNRNYTCHTLRPTTRVSWIYTLSGDTEADAVAQYGPALCSHCFKSAPVEWIQQAKVQKDGDRVITLAEAQAIADEKAAKKAAKEAKAAARRNR